MPSERDPKTLISGNKSAIGQRGYKDVSPRPAVGLHGPSGASASDLRWRPLPTAHALDLAAVAARLAEASLVGGPVAGLAGDGPRAAVAAILREGGDASAEALLIRRADRPSDPWSGHMAFPGGRRDPADADLYATAVRETREEVGLDLEAHGALLGRLPEIEAGARGKRTGLVVAPYVFALARDVPLVIRAEEVAEALWIPLAPLARGEGAGTIPWEVHGQTFEMPCWRVEGRVIWGLTYRMLVSLFEILGVAQP